MQNPDRPEPSLTIGNFARRTGLTVKALRIYERYGLLLPAAVDPATGYRRYVTQQIETARLIGLLRGADMSLAHIKALLDAAHADPQGGVGALDAHLGELETHHAARRVLIQHIRSLLLKETPMTTTYSIETRHMPAQRVMSMSRRLHVDAIDDFATEARAAFADLLGGAAPVGPFTLIYHGTVDDQSDGPIEATMGCPDHIQPTDTVGVRTEPAHDTAYTTITKAQWAFPAILAAYDAVACSDERVARNGSQLSCREIYLADPSAIGDNDPVCEISFPLA